MRGRICWRQHRRRQRWIKSLVNQWLGVNPILFNERHFACRVHHLILDVVGGRLIVKLLRIELLRVVAAKTWLWRTPGGIVGAIAGRRRRWREQIRGHHWRETIYGDVIRGVYYSLGKPVGPNNVPPAGPGLMALWNMASPTSAPRRRRCARRSAMAARWQ